MNESIMQAILMNFIMEYRGHAVVLPNATRIYRWETDILSITRGEFAHEYEIKVSASDYLADFRKRLKHQRLSGEINRCGREIHGVSRPLTPNYFWYATSGFDIANLPVYAGWLRVSGNSRFGGYDVEVVREAPRLHGLKVARDTQVKLARWLSYKLKNLYRVSYLDNNLVPK